MRAGCERCAPRCTRYILRNRLPHRPCIIHKIFAQIKPNMWIKNWTLYCWLVPSTSTLWRNEQQTMVTRLSFSPTPERYVWSRHSQFIRQIRAPSAIHSCKWSRWMSMSNVMLLHASVRAAKCMREMAEGLFTVCCLLNGEINVCVCVIRTMHICDGQRRAIVTNSLLC